MRPVYLPGPEFLFLNVILRRRGFRFVLVSELSFALNLSEDDALKKLEEQLT